MGITYDSKDIISVQTRDRVTVRILFFFKFIGTVVYLPGVSPKRQDMKYDGRRKICIKYDRGTFDGEGINPVGQVDSKMKFLKRGEAISGIQPDDIVFSIQY